jgi:hypothetical protein
MHKEIHTMRISKTRRSLLRRAAALAATVTAIGLAGPLPSTAHAAATDNCGPNSAMTCVGAFVHVDVIGNTEDVAASCTATGIDTAATTGVQCYLVGSSDGKTYDGIGGTLWEPGTTATTAAVFGVPIQPYTLCIAGGWVGVLGSFNPIQNPVCSTGLID